MTKGKWGFFRPWHFAALLIAQLALSACSPSSLPMDTAQPENTVEPLPPELGHSALQNLIPVPVEVSPGEGQFELHADTVIYYAGGESELAAAAGYLSEQLSPATGFELAVQAVGGTPGGGHIYLALDAGDEELGEEGYRLVVTSAGVTISANCPAGVFYGIQTLRQLLPPAVEAPELQPGPWTIPAAVVRDYPRFEWRGVMLDVARHFFSVEDVKRYIDLAALYKINRFHMHLTDDQGWRIMIDSWPELALKGGQSAVGGDPGGYYTQAQYADLAAYAHSRHMVLVPEIDMPGHTNAALNAYPELNCDGIAPPVHTGLEVGFSSLCIREEVTYRFVEDVIRELAAITPGAYIHIGGDETQATLEEDYRYFIERVQQIVASHGKKMVGWEEIAQVELQPTSIVQVWNRTMIEKAVRQEARMVMSPAVHTYLDMKYNPASPLGLSWAAFIEVKDSYDWDPVGGPVKEALVLGVEAPLWSETLRTIEDIEYMAFPRLPGLAEIAWSPREGRGWEEYRLRLAAHGARLEALGINFYRSPQVPWE